MLIVAGHLIVEPTDRDRYVAECVAVVELARVAPGCFDFAVCADTVDPARVNIFERWATEAELLAFRDSGPDGGMATRIRSADVKRYGISAVGDP